MQETLHFDPAHASAITSLRSKEEAHDYRYFPEPDLVPVAITRADARRRARGDARAAGRRARAAAARARAERRQRAAARLPRRARRLLRGRRSRVTVDPPAPPQALANWVAGELVARLRRASDPAESQVAPAALAALVGLVAGQAGHASAPARQVLDRLVADGGDPAAIVEAEGLGALGGGDDELAAIVAAALAANPDAAEKVRAGNMKAIGAIIGHVMRETKGRADGGEVTRLVHEQLAG